MKNFLAQPMAEPFIYDRIVAYLPRQSKHEKILDIASGQGYVTERLHHKGFQHIYAADIDPQNFKLNKNAFHFKQIDANQILPYRDNFFDVVISSETIEHLVNPRQFLSELHRILKPKGVLILTTPNITNIFSRLYFLIKGRLAFHTPNDYRLSGHIAVLPDWLLKYFFREIGFSVKSQTYSSCYLPLIKLRLTQNLFLHSVLGWITIYKLIKTRSHT